MKGNRNNDEFVVSGGRRRGERGDIREERERITLLSPSPPIPHKARERETEGVKEIVYSV